MHYALWIAGWILALAWFSRIAEAALGMPRIADIAKPEWDRQPAVKPRVSIIVPARNEEADIEQGLTRLLALDYDNYEVIVVDDRSTDRTGEIVDRVAASPAAHGCLRVVHVADAYDAITSARAYRAARSGSDALRELWRCAGTEFHAEIVGALANALPGVTSDTGHAELEHV